MKALEQLKEEYINQLLKNHNMTNDSTQKNLFSKEDYERILDPFFRVIKNNPDCTIEELRDEMYRVSGLEESVRHFIRDRKLAPTMSISYGTNNYKETLSIGNIRSKYYSNSSHTLYDIASVSKVFTSISILKLAQLGVIELNEKIGKYIPEFENIKDFTIFDLLTFQVPLKSERISKEDDYDSAFDKLKNIEVNSDFNTNANPYTDMGAMVLRYVVEKASNMKLFDFVESYMLKNADMHYTKIVKAKSDFFIADTNNVYSFYNDGNIGVRNDIKPGIVNDEKARVLGQNVGDFAGHSGIFTSSDNMAKFAHALLNREILYSKVLEDMSINETGREIEPGKYRQYLGKLCYSKNPILENSEVYHPLSGRTFGSGGWTGTQFTLDPINNIFFFMGANRTNNRAVLLGPEARKNMTEKGLIYTDKDGAELIRLEDGSEIVNAVRFAWDRDEAVVHPALRLALSYGLLEHIYKEDIKDKSNSYVLNRKI